MKLKRLTQKTITNSLGVYIRMAETKDFIYFVNPLEGDENGQTKMYRKEDLTLVSDNYFATVSFWEDAENGDLTWVNPKYTEELAEIVANRLADSE